MRRGLPRKTVGGGLVAASSAPLLFQGSRIQSPAVHGVIFASFVDYVAARHGSDVASEILSDQPVFLLSEAYEDERWVELSLGPPGVLEVRDTNYCRVSLHVDGRTGRVIVFAAIDNLWKGAASQAVQNLNLMFGRDESEGLE